MKADSKPNAVPVLLVFTIRGMHGQIAAGTSAYAIPTTIKGGMGVIEVNNKYR